MRNMQILPIIIVAFLLSTSMTFAGHHYGHNYMMPSWNMNEMDTNQDGILSFDEFSESHSKQLRTGFDMIDANKDGTIDEDEWNDFLHVHGVKKSN